MGTPEPDVAGDADTIVVVTGAAALDPRAVAALPVDALVIAADGGLDHALAADIEPDVLVGDLDSVSPQAQAWAEQHAELVIHPTDKALTDTELAIAHAVERNPKWITLVAGVGDRLDHTIAAIGALGAPATAPIPRVDGWWGNQAIHVLRPGRAVWFERPAGTTFSVLALHGPCRGVTITGARWPLTDYDLAPVVGVGVSNEVSTPPVHITVGDGVLTVIVQAADPRQGDVP